MDTPQNFNERPPVDEETATSSGTGRKRNLERPEVSHVLVRPRPLRFNPEPLESSFSPQPGPSNSSFQLGSSSAFSRPRRSPICHQQPDVFVLEPSDETESQWIIDRLEPLSISKKPQLCAFAQIEPSRLSSPSEFPLISNRPVPPDINTPRVVMQDFSHGYLGLDPNKVSNTATLTQVFCRPESPTCSVQFDSSPRNESAPTSPSADEGFFPEAPKFRVQPTIRFIEDYVDIVVRVTAHPKPRYFWVLNEVPIVETERVNTFINWEGDNSYSIHLRIKPANNSDSGCYKCGIKNQKGHVVSEVELKLRDYSAPKIVVQGIWNIHNDQLVLRLKFTSMSPSEITWKKDSRVLLKSLRRGIVVLSGKNHENTAKLIVKTLKPSDDGIYTCTISNSAGSVTETFKVVQVRKVSVFHGAVLSIDPMTYITRFEFNFCKDVTSLAWFSPDNEKLIDSERLMTSVEHDDKKGDARAVLKIFGDVNKMTLGNYCCILKAAENYHKVVLRLI